MDWKEYRGKEVYIRLSRGREYSGKVEDVTTLGEETYIILIDKYGKRVTFAATEVKLIEEQNGQKM